jgi:outer membrane protein OmpA-like peptidoglycan-associated protein
MRILAALLVAATGTAHADGWLVAETPAAVAVSDAQQGAFRPGIMPALGAYAGDARLAFGARLRAGILRNGPAPGHNLEDPGVGGLTTLGLAVRLQHRGGWVELVGGGGLTGSDLVPAVEAGFGWSFAAGSVDVGPSARFARVVSRDAMDAFGSADLLLLGVDVRFGRDRARRRFERVAIAPPPNRIEPASDPVDRDVDRIVEREQSCRELLDGCPIADDVVIAGDRIILEEHVLFDFQRARVRSHGRAVIAAIAKLWQGHPEWQRITIEGHTCDVGDEDFNFALSRLRAERVRDVLLRHGFTLDRIDAMGYGPTRPRQDGTTDHAREKNRRVEFVIVREGGAP